MKIKFNSGYKIMPEKQMKILDVQEQKQASENVSNVCARIKQDKVLKELLG